MICNNYNLKHFEENKLSNLYPIIASPYIILYQLLTTVVSNTSVIVARKTHVTVTFCVYKVVLAISSPYKMNMFLLHFETCMHMQTQGTVNVARVQLKQSNSILFLL